MVIECGRADRDSDRKRQKEPYLMVIHLFRGVYDAYMHKICLSSTFTANSKRQTADNTDLHKIFMNMKELVR